MKLIRIRFTAWRDDREAPRSSDLQRKLDAWMAREHVLRGAVLHVLTGQVDDATEPEPAKKNPAAVALGRLGGEARA